MSSKELQALQAAIVAQTRALLDKRITPIPQVDDEPDDEITRAKR